MCGAKPLETRVLRGGSFNLSQGSARCALRYNGCPGDQYDYFGFRDVVSPGF